MTINNQQGNEGRAAVKLLRRAWHAIFGHPVEYVDENGETWVFETCDCHYG